MTREIISEGFMQLITPDLYIMVFAVYGLCFALKKAAFFDDRFIPLVAIALGVAFEVLYAVLTGGMIVDFVLKGIISGMAAVYVANIVKQMGSEKNG
ncbi:MAG: hypothetical protein IJ299_00780 [Oscillospiraceae bacterium]|nr:hypothetical protein [Oscillospiraceae bacterium]